MKITAPNYGPIFFLTDKAGTHMYPCFYSLALQGTHSPNLGSSQFSYLGLSWFTVYWVAGSSQDPLPDLYTPISINVVG